MFHEIRRIDRTFAALNIDLPKPCQDATALAAAALAATSTNPSAELNDGILAGTITAKNIGAKLTEAAVAVMAAERIHSTAEATQSAINTMYYGALRANADSLVEALRAPFSEAAKTINTAGQHFAHDANERTILNAGPEAVDAWRNLSTARSAMAEIRNARAIIAEAERDHSSPYLHYITGALNQAELWEAEAEYTGLGDGLHNLARAGYTLHLNTGTEAAALAKTAQTRTEKERDAAEAARIAETKANDPLAFEVAARQAMIAQR
ncbi:rubrerythrin [Arthrobacter sp. UYNi723]